jgi:hypothetical protein
VTYEGPDTAWGWYQHSGTGSYVAMSALMALRQWALVQATRRPLREVVNEVLGISTSIAVAAVAYSLLLSHLEAADGLIDDYLASPKAWDLELSRVVSSNLLAYRWSDADTLARTPDTVTMMLVLNGSQERREELAALGQRLLKSTRVELVAADGAEPPDDHPELLVAERRSRGFDIAAYRAEPTEDPTKVAISVEIPAEVQERLERTGGKEATLRVKLQNLAFTTMKVRDGEKIDLSAADLFAQVNATLTELQTEAQDAPPHMAAEAWAAAAATIIVRAAASQTTDERTFLPEAVGRLIDVASAVTPDVQSYFDNRDTAWDLAPDRSAATALPRLLNDEALLAACDHDRKQIQAAVVRLAQSPSGEVRGRLVAALDAVWKTQCQDDLSTAAHETALMVYRELLLNAGIGPWDGNTRPRVRLEEPLAEALTAPGILLDLPAAADAVPGLHAAAAASCAHATKARELLETLVQHDLAVWPSEWAGEHYDGSDSWRDQLNKSVAAEVLVGDDALLSRYLKGFASVPEELAGLLVALVEQALTPEQGERLLSIWPQILAHLLPEARIERTGNEGANWRDTAALDRALLPKRPKNANWPAQPWVAVLQRWSASYTDHPELVDRLLICMGSQGVALIEAAIPLVLKTLGIDARRILRASQYITAWLQLFLVEHPNAAGDHRATLQGLVDLLAAAGSSDAISIQRTLEI